MDTVTMASAILTSVTLGLVTMVAVTVSASDTMDLVVAMDLVVTMVVTINSFFFVLNQRFICFYLIYTYVVCYSTFNKNDCTLKCY